MNNNNNNENNQKNIQSQPLSQKELEKKQNHEASQDVAHTVGKGAATYFGGALGNKLYDVASKTKLGQGIEKGVGKALESSPVAKPIMNSLHKSGATKLANTAIDTLGGKKNPNMLKGAGAKTTIASPKNANINGINSINRGHNLVEPPKNLNTSNGQNNNQNIALEKEQNEILLRQQIQQEQEQEELLQQDQEEKEKKKKENSKAVLKVLIQNPAGMLLIVGSALLIIIIFWFIIYFIIADFDLIGTQMNSYSKAETISGYCNQIILIKEHDDFSGKAVSNIDDVDLEETFVLNKKNVKRWSKREFDVETYVKGVVQAEAIDVQNEKTFEVAAIAARTYALQITSKRCFTWDNTNKRPEYHNPQNFTDSTVDGDVSSAVMRTNGLVVTLDNKLLNMSGGNYYDYFCHIGRDVEKDEHSFYKMLQKNNEERLYLPIDWVNKNVPKGDFNRSGKYDGDCQQDGMSLFGAKYLLNKKADDYTTIRIIKYYYGYHTELKRVSTSTIASGCSEINMKSTQLSKEAFVQAVSNYSIGRTSIKPLSDIASTIYDMGVQNNVNPELVFIRAAVEGYSPGGSTNNFWGIGCTNTGGTKACKSYSSVTEGVLAFMKNVSRYDTLEAMMRKYAYLGDYWYNPGSSSLGGCYYAPYIYPNGIPSRVTAACSGASCTKEGGNCTPTTEEDHHSYAMYQAKSMFTTRKAIFNLDSDNCENTASTGGIATASGACSLWSQADSAWADRKLGTSNTTMKAAGCLVTSLTMALSCSGAQLTENINPSIFLDKLNAANSFSGAEYKWATGDIVIKSLASNFIGHSIFQTNKKQESVVSTIQENNGAKNMILLHISNSSTSQHWVLFRSLNGNTITVYDPSGGKINTYKTTEIQRIAVYKFA